jgi:AraC family transcriptional regulator
VQQFESGLHACAAFDGTPDRIHAAWTFMYRDWLPGSGYQPAPGPSFESYGREIDWDRATGRFSCELCVPVRPL